MNFSGGNRVNLLQDKGYNKYYYFFVIFGKFKGEKERNSAIGLDF